MKAKKKILSLLLAIAMILGMLPMTAMPVYAAENLKASSVTLTTSEGQQTLDSQYPYLVNNEKKTTGVLGSSGCTAYFDSANGTLTLHNYNGKTIASGDLGGAQDLTVKLMETNIIIDGSLYNESGGDLTITADSSASLSITQSGDTSQILEGIATQVSGNTSGPGSITIGGHANITISVTNTNTGDFAKAYGIFAKQDILIEGDASLNIICVAHSQVALGGAATGIYTENKNITFNTTGAITVDCSNGTNLKSRPLRSYDNILTKVGTMTLKYTTGGVAPAVIFNTGAFVKSKPNVTTETYVPGPMTVNLTPGDGKVTLNQASSEPGYGFAYTTSTSSVSAPESGSALPAGAITVPAGGSVDISATNGTQIFVQVYKFDGGTLEVYGFGEASAIPTADSLTYALTVVNGTGGGTFAENAVVNIAATVPGGKVFKQWESSGGGTFASATSASTTFTMPAEAVTVTATFEDAPVTTYAVTVNSGTGGGDFAEGATVSITANAPATGKVFDKWTTSDGVTFGDANTANTTFVMPAKAVTVTATYKDAPVTTYAVTVNSGTGGGNYAEGATVNITANAPATGKVFDKWTTLDGVVFANANSATTTFVMPAKAVTVTATYKDAPVTTYAVTVNSGTGGGNYAADATVSITANEPATGKVFDKWTTSDGVTFGDENTANTTFVMPAKAVTVTATYKDAPVTTYTVTLSGGGSGATGAGSYTKDATVNINAGSRTGYTFTGWTSLDVTITNPNNTNASFTMPAKAVTVTANWSYSGGGGGGGGTSAPQQTIPAADGAVQVNYTTSGGTASLSLPESKINDIIAKSKGDEALIDLSKVSGATAAELPKAALTAFGEAGLGLGIQLPAGSITLNQEAAADIAGQATASNLKLELKQAASSSLTAAQREAIKSGDMVLDINIYSGTDKITQFDGKLTINVPYTGPQPVAVWYLNDKGELEKLIAVFANGIVSFELNHLSLYVLGQDTDWVNPFADIQEADWFYKAVEYVYENGLMVGTGDTAFDPNGTTTRAMIVTILHRLEQTPAPTANNPFSDVADGKWYTNAVVWAAESGIVSGYGNDTFGPEDNITREQMAAILYRYAQLKSYDVSGGADLSKFNDAENISGWALRSLGWANEKGLITGTSDVTLDPQGQATRAQVAAILMRFCESYK